MPTSLCRVLITLALLFATTPFTVARADTPAPLHGDARTPPVSHLRLAASDDRYQPSQYMAGVISVRVVLPESDGSADASSENWTSERIAAVSAHVQNALDWWAARLPLAQLRFRVTVQVAPTSYEPIAHANEGPWVHDALGRLGFAGEDHFEQAYAAAAALRAADGSDWATTIFLVNSDADADGRFPDGMFAYAYVGGPYLVITSDAGPYGAAHLAPIVAHEFGHIFGALDQYASANVPCSQRSGYLDAPTLNSQAGGCPLNQQSIMRDPAASFPSGEIDAGALAQLGYRDSDGDAIIDPLDTTPVLELDPLPATINQSLTLIGSARDEPLPAASQPPRSINRIVSLEYRVDGGAWRAATPAWADERFTLTPKLYDGDHALDVRAVNSAGNRSEPVARQISVTGAGDAPPVVTYQVLLPLVARP
jgi:hypothetical protein